MSKKSTYDYPGDKVTVSWNEGLCIHIGECGYAKGELFVAGRDPWCKPDLVSAGETVEVVKRCPSGALSYQFSDGSHAETAATENTLIVAYNGPYYVQGDLDIEAAAKDQPGVQFRAALCRCGLSKNKPFCDNSHEGQFKDYAAVGETGTGVSSTGGKLGIKALPDGPLLFSGNLTIYAGSGRKAWQGDNVALCRCGASKNKPFCDGMHKEIGFKSS